MFQGPLGPLVTFSHSKSVTINETDKDTWFQHEVTTGVHNITFDGSRYKLTWSIHKDEVSVICCVCDVIIWVDTRSSNMFKDSFGSCKYICLYSNRSVASYFIWLFTLNFFLCGYVCVCEYMTCTSGSSGGTHPAPPPLTAADL